MREPLSNQFITRCLLAFLVALIVPSGVWAEDKEAICSNFGDYDAFFRANNDVDGSNIGTANTPWTLTLAAGGSAQLNFYCNSYCYWKKVSFNVTTSSAATITIGGVSKEIAAGGTETLDLDYSSTDAVDGGSITISSNAATTITFKSITLTYELQPMTMSWSTYDGETETYYTESNPYPLTFTHLEESVSPVDFNYNNDYASTSSITFSSSDESVATIESSAEADAYPYYTITPKKAGSTVITASFAGNDNLAASTASFTLNVTDGRTSPSLAFENETATTSFSPSSDIVTDINTLSYVMDSMSVVVTSSDPTIAQVVKVQSGEVTTYSDPATSITLGEGYIYGLKILKVGTATITATYPGGYLYTTGETSYTLTVNPLDLSLIEDIQYEGIEESYTYTGSEIKPEPTITIGGTETVLTKDTDYELSYLNNVNVPASGSNDVPTIVITFKGNYTGTVYKTFTIDKATPEITTYPTAKSGLTYTGSEQELITAGVVTGGTLQYSQVYTDENSWSSTIPAETNAGTYYIYYRIEGGDNYNDVECYNYQYGSFDVVIDNATTTINATAQTSTYTGEAINYSTDNITITPTSLKSSLGIDYYNGDPTTDSGEILDGAPTNAGTYYIRIYLEADNYTAEEKITTLTINEATPSLTTIPTAAELTFTGEAQALVSGGVVENGTLQYALGTDATTAPEEYAEAIPTGTNADTYYVWYMVVGNDNYSNIDPTVIPVTIGQASISPAVSITGWTYGATASTPSVTGNTGEGTVTYTYKVKNAADDTYSETVPTDAGDYTVKATVAATMNYNSGTGTADFTISQADISTTTIATIAEQTYTGSAITPKPDVTLGTGETAYTLIEGTDFTYSYENNTNVPASGSNDVPRVFITGIGNFTGTNNTTFTITQGAASITTAPVAKTDLTYNGEELALVEAGESNFGQVVYCLEENGNYSETIPTGTDAETYRVYYKVEATNNYTGTTVAFVDVTISAASATITANAQTSEFIDDAIEYNLDNVTITPSTIDKEYLLREYYKDDPSKNPEAASLEAVADAGTYYVRISLSNDEPNYKAEPVITTLTINQKAATIEFAESAVTKTFGDVAFIIDLTNSGDGAVTYASNNTTVATVNEETGEVTITGAGEATITATAANGTNYTYATNTATFTLTVSANTTGLTVALSEDAPEVFTFTATAKTPAVVVKSEDTTLESSEYTVVYTNNMNAGTATINVTGSGNYAGAVGSTSFTINPASIENAVFGDIDAVTYTGQELKPTTTLSLSDSTLTAGTDYEFSYSNNINVAAETSETQPTITATGKGNYTGSVSTSFVINKADVEFTAPTAKTGLTYTGSAQELITAGTATGGEMQYSTDNKEFSTAIPKGTNAGDYTIYYKVVGDANHNDYTAETAITASIAKAAPTIVTPPTPKTPTYSGEAQELVWPGEATNGTILFSTDNETFSETIPTGTNADSYTVYYKVAGADNYSDIESTQIADVAIAQAEMGSVNYTAVDDQTYTGEALTPTITAIYNSATVSTDQYSLSYADNTNVGTATITVTAAADGNFKGTATLTFKITAKSIEKLSVSEIEAQAYTGEAITPEVTVKDGETTLTKDTDYTLEYSDNIEVGTAAVIITGKGNYQGTIQTSFTINTQLDITFASGQTWATYVSTTNLTVPEGLNAYLVTSVSGTTVNVEQINYLPAESAVLLEKTSTAGSTFTAEAYPEEIPEFTNLLEATFEDTDIANLDAPNIYVLYNNEFRRATSGSIPANRGYLALETATAGAHLFISDGSATNIKRIADEAEEEQWYTLDGRKLSGRPQIKGVYIRNGKKIYVSKK